MNFLFVFVNIIYGSCILLKGKVIIVVKSHFFLMKLAVAIDQGLHNFKLQIGRGKPVVMLFINMNNKLTSETTNCHSNNIAI